MKRAISLVFALMILALCLVQAAAAETTDPAYIYFAVPRASGVSWNNFSMVYCHIWSKTGGDIYGWQEKDERCEDLGNGYWRYDLSTIDFAPDGEYSLIFSNENGMQTYNLNITSSCLGDIVVCEGDTTVNPVDGEKSCAVARWLNNGDKVHPAVEIDSNGKTVNVDEIDPADAETVWGTGEGTSYELPEAAADEPDESADDAAEDTDAAEDGELLIAPAPDSAADNADGINTNTATVWIIIVCAVVICAIVVVVIVLAKKNKKK